ncbi:hypothetical protein MKY91_03075 [Alkalicoccobacillus gibsonii]|uniref:Pilus assembly protein n=1 Tax=Alkalicoccobacillus gibsonii TaxID=79881 RepID=A0ABU9VE25_9BACI
MIKKFINDERGNLTLEAAIIMPMFLLFVVFMAMIIRISIADMALKKAVNETAEIYATHAYPVAMVTGAIEKKTDELIKEYTGDATNLDEINEFLNFIFKETGISPTDMIYDAAEGPTGNLIIDSFNASHDDALFEADAMDVKITDRPSLSGSGENAYIGIEASYKLRIVAPFIDKEITLKHKGYERLWTGA